MAGEVLKPRIARRHKKKSLHTKCAGSFFYGGSPKNVPKTTQLMKHYQLIFDEAAAMGATVGIIEAEHINGRRQVAQVDILGKIAVL